MTQREVNGWCRQLFVSILVFSAACSRNSVDIAEMESHSARERIIAASVIAWPNADGEDVGMVVRMIQEQELQLLGDSLEALTLRSQPTESVPNSPSRCTVRVVDGCGRHGWISVRLDVSAPYLLLGGEHFADTLGGARAGRIDIQMDTEEGQYWRSLFMEAAPVSIVAWAADVVSHGKELCRSIAAFQSEHGSLPTGLAMVANWNGGSLLADGPQPVEWLYSRLAAGEYELRARLPIWGEEKALLVYRSSGEYPLAWIGSPTLVKRIGTWLFIGDARAVDGVLPDTK